MQPINCLLLIEDDENDIILTERKIQRAHLPLGELVVVRTVDEAMRTLATRPIDVVLLDLNLGEFRGLDTLDVMRPLVHGVLIVLTSIDDEQTGIEAIRRGADDYLVKNRLTEQGLRTSIAYALTRHSAHAAIDRFHKSLDRLTEMTQGK